APVGGAGHVRPVGAGLAGPPQRKDVVSVVDGHGAGRADRVAKNSQQSLRVAPYDRRAMLHHGSRRPLNGLAALAVAAVLLSACGGSGVKVDLASQQQGTQAAAGLPSPNPLNPSTVATLPTVEVVHRVAPAVVNVTTRTVGA